MSFEVIDSYTVGQLSIQILSSATSACAQHPSASINVPAGWKILGGGAAVNWEHSPCIPEGTALGNMLTAMHPSDDGTSWFAESKDHIESSPAQIVAYCIVAQMTDGTPIPDNHYQVIRNTSDIAAHPFLRLTPPTDWDLTGGGAKANYMGRGSMLYGSFPGGGNGWVGYAKDHIQSDPSSITLWAICLRRSFLNDLRLRVVTVSKISNRTNHPNVLLYTPNFNLISGGATLSWESWGSLLTQCFPLARATWFAQGKDHLRADPSTITVLAMGIREV